MRIVGLAVLLALVAGAAACGNGGSEMVIEATPLNGAPASSPDAEPSPEDADTTPSVPPPSPSTPNTPAASSPTPSPAPADPPGTAITYDATGSMFTRPGGRGYRPGDGGCPVPLGIGEATGCAIVDGDPAWGVVVWDAGATSGADVVVARGDGFDAVVSTPVWASAPGAEGPRTVTPTAHVDVVEVDVTWPDGTAHTEVVGWGESTQPGPLAVAPRAAGHASWYVAGRLLVVAEAGDGQRQVDVVTPGAVFEGTRWTRPFGTRLNEEVALRFLAAWQVEDRDAGAQFATRRVVRNLFALVYSPDTLLGSCDGAVCMVHRYRPELTNVGLEIGVVDGTRSVVGWHEIAPDPEGDV